MTFQPATATLLLLTGLAMAMAQGGPVWPQIHPHPHPQPLIVTGKPCLDPWAQQWVADRSVLGCAQGGTRMCENGSWKVLNGVCQGFGAIIGGKPQFVVGASAPGTSKGSHRRMLLSANNKQSIAGSTTRRLSQVVVVPTPMPQPVPLPLPTSTPQPVIVTGKPCLDPLTQQWVADRSVLGCAQGGTRICQNGSWRVLNGVCQGFSAIIGGHQTVVVGAGKP